jgi:uncharacterized repeat protein (TIGR03803 family)
MVVAAILLMLTAAIAAPAQTYSVVYTFGGGADGDGPAAPLIADAAGGGLYGTTAGGGSSGNGVVFRIRPPGYETVLHEFTGPDGAVSVAGLVSDAVGNVYGTTAFGGEGSGVVFKVDPTLGESVLHAFSGGSDGATPQARLLRDAAGNLYGTAAYGGTLGNSCSTFGCGVVFKVDPAGNFSVLHSFTGADGAFPFTGVVRDSLSNLYGTTDGGGAYGYGTVFKLDPAGNETVLYSFTGGADGARPQADMVEDSAGNLYGTTAFGGITGGSCVNAPGCGVVFKVESAGNFAVLHSFSGPDGDTPEGALIRDPAGNLYGTTAYGGSYGYGTIFKLSSGGTETVLFEFAPETDGSYPVGGLLPYKGALYGTTSGGAGGYCCGVAFRLSLH